MDNLITIYSSVQPQSIYLAKGKLESEGIECFIKDEFTTQVNNFYSNAIGGVKLQIYQKDEALATQLLIEGGLIEESKPQDNSVLSKLNSSTARLPIIGSMIIEKRLLILSIAFLVLIFTPILMIGLYVPMEEKIAHKWCIERFEFDNKLHYPIHEIKNKSNCAYYIEFQDNGQVYLPHFEQNYGRAEWFIAENGKLVIYNADHMENVYNGAYSIEIKDDKLILESERTKFETHISDLENSNIIYIQ